MSSETILVRSADHKKARVDSLVIQLKQVNNDIHALVEEIKVGVDSAKNSEQTIHQKREIATQNLTAATLLMINADPKLKQLKAEDIVSLSQIQSPPRGLEALITCCVYLLANGVPESIIEIDVEKRPKHTDWSICQQLLSYGEGFIQALHKVRERIDKIEISNTNIECVKTIFSSSLFEFEKVSQASETTKIIYEYVQSLLSYYDLIFVLTMSQKDVDAATSQLEETSKKLLKSEEEMQRLKLISDQLYLELNKAAKEP